MNENVEMQNGGQDNNYLAYNFSISKVKMIDMSYSEANKEMCEVALFGVLQEIFHNEEVYHRVLQTMRDNGLYERYLRCILELQFNPPPNPNATQQAVGEENPQSNNSQQNNNNNQNGNIATKIDKSKDITNKFIRDLFNDDNFNL